ncbi:MAG: M20 family metallopeptidase [Faecousia sp.]
MNNLLLEAQNLAPEIVNHRRWLHAHAETGFGLTQTKAYVKDVLTQMGYTPMDCGKAGLFVTIGPGGGKTILLRADMDALPICEESGVSFASNNGNMHACGHDMHTAMLLGAAQLLMEHRDELNGSVKLMFQPAEEIFEGSKDMIESGILENPKPDAALMIHVTAGIPLPAGTVIVSAPGVTAPAADYFTIAVQGKGCHGSAPQDGIDPLPAAAHIILGLQQIQTRELPATEEVVLTIGKVTAGSAPNAVANSVVLQGTIRTYDEKTRAYVKQRLEEISKLHASACRATAEVSFGSGCPTLVNDPELAQKIYEETLSLLGTGKVLTAAQLSQGGKPSRGGGSEDFAYISQHVPSLMLALAAGEPRLGYTFPQHHPQVRFDEAALPVGAAVLANAALTFTGA